jgi:hypothetical protein
LRRPRIGKDQTRPGVPSRKACDFLPTANRNVDIERVQFDCPRDSACPLGRQDGRATAAKWIEDDAVPAAAVANQIGE